VLQLPILDNDCTKLHKEEGGRTPNRYGHLLLFKTYQFTPV